MSASPASTRLDAALDARLLLIDDNPADRELLARELQRAGPGLRLTHVTNARELDAELERGEFDLAVTDYHLRWTDGIEVVRRIKACDPPRPVIMFTASGSEEIAVAAMKEGLDDYITKTAKHFPRIPYTVAAVLERARQRHELHRSTVLLRETQTAAAEQVRISEERFRAVQETSPDGFTVLDAVRDEHGTIVDFRFAYMNEAAARIARAPRELLIGKRVLEVHPGNLASGVFQRYVDVANGGTTWVGEVDYDQDGIQAVVRLAVARVGDGVAISTVDVSERKRAEDALREADRQKDEFIAMLAHELRNPLAPIRNAGELLARMYAADRRALEVVDIVRRQAAHLTRLVDDLLDVSRITRRRIELKHETVDLALVIAQAVETVEPLVRSRRHKLRILTGDRPSFVTGDFARLVQCLVNLLTNAAKFTDVGGDILIELRQDDGHAIVDVCDSGVGISATLLPKVFDLFVQNDQTLDRAQGGLGIGLSVVQKLIEMHGGQVNVRSEGPGRGATFSIRLPLVAPPATVASAAAQASLSHARFLVVDDNVDAADTLAAMLQAEGHAATAVHSAHEVLGRVRGERPDFVLLDIGLPSMDGYEVAGLIRSLPADQQPRIVALTGYGQPQDRARALEAGFDEHFVKPVDIDALLRRLAELARPGGR